MLSFVFGAVKKNVCHIRNADVAAGYLELKHARVRWFLSVNAEYLPDVAKNAGQTTYRSITVDGYEFEFSGGFTDLHTRSYEEILAGNGFGLDAIRDCIGIVHEFRNIEPIGLNSDCHPFCCEVK